MRRYQSLFAMVLVTILFLIFLSSFHLEKTHSHKVEQKELRKQPIPQTGEDLNATILPLRKKASLPSLKPKILNVTVSSGLTKVIPQNKAYWNRLFYSSLGRADKQHLDQPSWSHCTEVNREFLKINIHDFSSYPSMFQDFLLTMNCKSPPLLLNQPNKCLKSEADNGETFVLFAIKSRPGNFQQRQSVRETWGQEGVFQNGLRVRTLFLLGNHSPNEPDLGALLSFEATFFNDTLQWDFDESLLNLTLKMDAFLHWTLNNCPHVSFIFSGDDDVFVNTPALLDYLVSLEPSKSDELVAGDFISTASPLRDSKSKYYIPLSFYDGSYPPYVGGGGFVISGALLPRLYSMLHIIPFYPIDDVYIGICIKALGISPEAHPGFHTFDVSEQDRNNLCVHKGLILTHQRSPAQLKILWKGINSPHLKC